ncbi:MAG: DUF2326 domain-containing protein, partial [Bacteroidetes bacterium]|nr:DUF2326 domain-containing protein [Bacteroidota bacterium]
INERRSRQTSLLKRQRELMSILESGGALEQYNELQQELGRLEARVQMLVERFANAETIEGEETQLNVERNQLLSRLRLDYKERDQELKKAILGFSEISKSVLEPGQLTISPELNGPHFAAHLEGDRSAGIRSMEIFCFDLLLTELLSHRNLGPGFLIHDSQVFDHMEVRQRANAIVTGAQAAMSENFQYIITLNSDQVPDDFELLEHVISPTLTDATADGGLFGVRF